MNTPVPIVICATKCDLCSERVIQDSEIEALKSQLPVQYMETSAKSRHNVNEAFSQLVKMIKPASPKSSKCVLI